MHNLNTPQNKSFVGLILTVFFLSLTGISASSAAEPNFTLKQRKDKKGYIINLKDLVDEAKEKIEKVDEEIEAQKVLKRNQEREAKAREYYQKAMEFYNQGKLEEAQLLWEKAIKITSHPEMKDYIRESVKKKKKEDQAMKEAEQRMLKRLELERGYSAEEVQKAYERGVSLFKQKKYIAAKYEFDKVEEMFPDHKATRSYLMLIDQEIKKEQQRLIAQKLKEESMEMQKAKDKWRKEIEAREKERKEKIKAQAEAIYQKARDLYAANKFKEAKEQFEEVEWIWPNYKSTRHYLSRVDIDIESAKILSIADRQRIYAEKVRGEKLAKKREEEELKRKKEAEEEQHVKRLEEEADFVYKAALKLYKDGEYQKAQEKLLEVQDILHDYKSTVGYLSKIDQRIEEEKRHNEEEKEKALVEKRRLQEQEKQRILEEEIKKKEQASREEAEKLEREADTLYNTALNFYKKEEYVKSKEKFNELQQKFPSYKSTITYLLDIEEKLTEKEKRKVEEEERLLQQRLEEKRLARKQEKRRSIKALKAEEERKVRELNKKAENLYSSAMALYDKKNYDAAQKEFRELNTLYPNYKSTGDYLSLITKAQEQQKAKLSEEQQKVFSQKARAEMKRQEYEEKRHQKKQKYEAQERLRKTKTEARIKYEVAVDMYKKELYPQAKEKFQEVNELLAGYRSTDRYLDKIDRKIKEYEERRQEQKRKILEEKKKREELALKLKEEKLKKEKEAKERERLLKLEKQAEVSYAAGVLLFDKTLYLQAKERFQNVNEMVPGYKSTDEYLKRIADKLAALEKEKIKKKEAEALRQKELEKKLGHKKETAALKQKEREKQLSEERKAAALKKQFEEKKALAQEQKADAENLRENRTNQEEEKQRLLRLAERKRIHQVTQTAAAVYRLAVDLYKQGKFVESREKFVQVNDIYPRYKDTAGYLKDIEIQLVRREKEVKEKPASVEKQQSGLEQLKRKVEPTYQWAVKLFHEGKYSQARAKFILVDKVHPGYKKTERYLDKIEDALRSKKEIVQMKAPIAAINVSKAEKIRNAERQRLEKIRREVDAKYRRALDFYNQGNFEEARRKFIEIEAVSPDYKRTIGYLKKISSLLEKQQKEAFAQVAVYKKAWQEKISSADDSVKKAQNESENIFKEGMELFKNKDYDSAKVKFIESLSLNPENKVARKYLQKTDNFLRKAGQIIPPETVEEQKVLIPKKELEPARISNLSDEERVMRLRFQEEKREATEKAEYEKLRSKLKEQDRLAKEKRKQTQKDMDESRRQMKYEMRQKKVVLAQQEALKTKERVTQVQELQRLAVEKASLHPPQRKKQEKIEVSVNDKQRKELQKKKLLERHEKERILMICKQQKQKAKQSEVLKAKDLEKQKKREERKKAKAEDLRQQDLAEQKATEDEKEKALQQKEIDEKQVQMKQALKEKESLESQKEKLLTKKESEKQKLVALKEEEKQTIVKEEMISKVMQEKKAELFIKKKREEGRQRAKERARILKQQSKIIDKKLTYKEAKQKERWADEIKEIYKEALALYKKNKFVEAKIKFSLVEGLFPGYKNAKAYINVLEKRMSAEQSRVRHLAKKEILVQEKEKEGIKNKLEYEKQKKLEEMKAEELREAKLREEEKNQKAKEEKMMEKEKAQKVSEEKTEELKKKKILSKEEKFKHQEEERVKRQKAIEEVKKKAELEERARQETIEKKRAAEQVMREKAIEEAKKKAELEEKARREALEKKRAEKQAKLEAEKERLRKEREKKQAVLLEKRQAEKKKKQERLEKIRSVEEIYNEIKSLYKSDDYQTALEKIDLIRKNFDKEILGEKYIAKMARKTDSLEKSVQIKIDKEKARQEEIQKKREEAFERERLEAEKKRQEEKLRLEKEIKEKEQILAKLKQAKDAQAREKQRQEELKKKKEEQLRLQEETRKQQEERKREKEAHQKELEALKESKEQELRLKRQEWEKAKQEANSVVVKEEEKPYQGSNRAAEQVSAETQKTFGRPAVKKVDKELVAKSKEKELKDLVAQRKEELRQERLRVQKELEANLYEVYKKAIKFYKKGSYLESKALFLSISQMRPDYKATEKYLAKLDELIKKSSAYNASSKEPSQVEKEKPDLKTRHELITDILDSFEREKTN